ncbi:MAG: TMEM175 family protein [Pyrinomonadaceae bacterium]|nr:TMEM175 family protein [Pyrinomonadaceae bacterium]
MNKTRLEAFSDAVIAIIMTIMVLELKVPHGTDLGSLQPLIPIFLSYVLSFVYLGIYWNNHHHMLQATRKVNGKVLWANLNLLFWLSLFPFATGWMGENHFAPIPTAGYGVVLLLAATAYTILQNSLMKHAKGENELLASAIGSDVKGKISLICYSLAIPTAFINTWISNSLYVFVAAMWFIPDRRIERKVGE